MFTGSAKTRAELTSIAIRHAQTIVRITAERCFWLRRIINFDIKGTVVGKPVFTIPVTLLYLFGSFCVAQFRQACGLLCEAYLDRIL